MEGTVHLVGGHNVKEGRVKICYNGEWHSVCGDRWSEMGGEADVVCSTLGYSDELGQEEHIYLQINNNLFLIYMQFLLKPVLVKMQVPSCLDIFTAMEMR